MQASILDDLDFELKLIHRDLIEANYILKLLAKLYDTGEAEHAKLRSLMLETISRDIELRNKRELIAKFIGSEMMKAGDAAEIPECFEAFREQERLSAFKQLVKDEQLDVHKLQ